MVQFVAVLALVLAPMGLGQAMAAETGSIDDEAAEEFVRDATWDDLGVAVDSPDFVADPQGALDRSQALETAGASGTIDTASAAEMAARLQTENGGFHAYAGDFLGPWTQHTGAGAVLATAEDVSIDEEGAEAFLRSMQNLDGGFAARVSIFGSNLDSQAESTYYATIGLDALDALDEQTRSEIVAFLTADQNLDGGWGYKAGAGTSIVSATYHAVKTLDHLGELDPATELRVAEFLHTVEEADGGFRERAPKPGTFCPTCQEPASVPSTGKALAIIATLDVGGLTFETVTHAQWLAEAQIDEGPYAGAFPLFAENVNPVNDRLDPVPDGAVGLPFPSPDPPVTNYARNTADALEGLAAHGQADAIEVDAALGFLAGTQQAGSGGVGWWEGYKESHRATAAAYQALELLNASHDELSANLADAMADRQTDEGAIELQRWKHEPRVDHTTYALQALAHAGQLDAVDVDQVAGYVADEQQDDGTFPRLNGQMSAVRTTGSAVDALARVGELDRLDRDALVQGLADLQGEDGTISDSNAEDTIAVWDTARALQALATLGELDAVDVDAAVDVLASTQTHGTFADETDAVYAVLGLAAADRLDAIDTAAAEDQLVSMQRDHGGFADKGITSIATQGVHPTTQHALALAAIDALDA
jgi:prenyltransferase beta subunit